MKIRRFDILKNLTITIGFFLLLILSLKLDLPSYAMVSPDKIVYVAGNKKMSLRAVREGYDRTHNNYWAKYEIKVEEGTVNNFKIEIGKYYCTITHSNSGCVGNPGTAVVERPTFSLSSRSYENDAYVLYISIPPIDGRHCGSFQSDLRIIAIDGVKVTTNFTKQASTNCSLAQDGRFNCGLPSDWQANCTQPTPTPNPTNTPTPTPTNSPTNTPTPTPNPTNTPTPTPNPTNTPTPTPQPSRQIINQTVNVNQNVNIQNSANNNQQVLGASTQKTQNPPKQMPKTGAETATLAASILSLAAGIYLKKRSL